MTNRLFGDDIQLDALAKAVGTSHSFELRGGYYDFSAHAATWGTDAAVTVEQLMPDGATYVAVGDGLGADGSEQIYLPPGMYRFAVTSALGADAAVRLARIPLGD